MFHVLCFIYKIINKNLFNIPVLKDKIAYLSSYIYQFENFSLIKIVLTK